MHPKFHQTFSGDKAAGTIELILKREPISPTIPKPTGFNNTFLKYKSANRRFNSTINTFEVEGRPAGYGNFGPQMLTTQQYYGIYDRPRKIISQKRGDK